MQKTLFVFACAILVLGLPYFGRSQTITTYAGDGTSGYISDGVAATTTEINFAWGITIDKDGNIIIGDSNNNRIRKVTPAGIITTIAGTGVGGFSGDNGPATAAQVNYPSGVAVDGAGNIYIADNSNYRVRKIDTSGIITTIAGNGVPSISGNGIPATAASLAPPDGIAADSAGNVYISSGYYVRMVNTSGIITMIAGNGTFGYSGDGGPATLAQVAQSSDLKVDRHGNVFFSDFPNHCVREIGTSGIITTVAGIGSPGFGGDGGPGTAASLDYPVGVDVDDFGNVYIGDRDNARVRKVSAAGVINTIAGTGTPAYSGDGGSPTSAEINWPHAITHDPCGNIYFSDRYNYRVRKITDPTLNFAGVVTGADTVCSGDTVFLANIITGGSWSLTNNTIAHITSSGAVRGISAGTDTIQYIVSYPCGTDTATKVLTVLATGTCATLGTATTAIPVNGALVYPNPSNGSFYIKVTTPGNDDAAVVITNMVGQLLKTLTIPTNKEVSVDLDVPGGVYFLSIHSGANNYAKKIFIR